jgi:hypothetical protein
MNNSYSHKNYFNKTSFYIIKGFKIKITYEKRRITSKWEKFRIARASAKCVIVNERELQLRQFLKNN